MRASARVGHIFNFLYVEAVIGVGTVGNDRGKLLKCRCLVILPDGSECGNPRTVVAKRLPLTKTCEACARARRRRGTPPPVTVTAFTHEEQIAALTSTQSARFREYLGHRTSLAARIEALELTLLDDHCPGCPSCCRQAI